MTFEVPGIDKLEFEPGQFVSLSDEVDGRPVTRAYSLASAPDGNRFELCLNRVNLGSFSPHLFALRRGGTVSMRQPIGTFTLRDPLSDSVFVATGTGRLLLALVDANHHEVTGRDRAVDRRDLDQRAVLVL